LGVALTAHSPLGSPDFSKNKSLFENKEVKEIAGRLNATPAQILLAWNM